MDNITDNQRDVFKKNSDRQRISEIIARIEAHDQKCTQYFQECMALTGGNIVGLELQKVDRNGEQRKEWVIMLLDASEPGRWRYQCYDEDGLFSHSTFDCQEEALINAIKEGYRKPDPGSLNRVSTTKRWNNGMAAIFAVQKSWR